MARKSVDFATSLKRFQRKSTSENQSSKGSDGSENSEESQESNSQEDLHKVKLVLQNQSLVKTNSCLNAKVKDLEKTIKNMFEERGHRRINDGIDKKLLEKRLNEMERCLVEQYNQELNNLQRIRQDFNLSLSKYTPIKSVTDHTFYLPSPIISTNSNTNNNREPPTVEETPDISKPNTTKNMSTRSPDVSIILEESEKEDSRDAISSNTLASDMDISQLSSLKQSSPKQKTIGNLKQSSPRKITVGKSFQIHRDTHLDNFVKVEQVPEKNKLQQNTGSQDDTENGPHRPKRSRKSISYKPIPLGAKLRRESSNFVSAVDENAFNFAVSESKKRRKVSSSQPLTDSTNVINSRDSPKINSELSIFDFEDDPVSRPNKSRRQTFNI